MISFPHENLICYWHYCDFNKEWRFGVKKKTHDQKILHIVFHTDYLIYGFLKLNKIVKIIKGCDYRAFYESIINDKHVQVYIYDDN